MESGFQEIVLIFIIALIIFGPRKLPEIGKTLGKSLAEFKRATNDLKHSWEEEVRLESEKLKQDVGSLEDPTQRTQSLTPMEMEDENGRAELGAKMSFLEHLDEFRKRLITCLIYVAVGFLGCWFFREELYRFISQPLLPYLPASQKLVYTKLTEGFTLYVKVSFIAAIFIVASAAAASAVDVHRAGTLPAGKADGRAVRRLLYLPVLWRRSIRLLLRPARGL